MVQVCDTDVNRLLQSLNPKYKQNMLHLNGGKEPFLWIIQIYIASEKRYIFLRFQTKLHLP